MLSAITSFFSSSSSSEQVGGGKVYRNLNETERKTVGVLLKLLATGNSLWLASHPKEVKDCKKALKETHPLAFVAATLDCAEHRNWMKEISNRGSYFWSSFISKTFESIQEEDQKFQNVKPHLRDFSWKVGLSAHEVNSFFENRDLSGIYHAVIKKYN